jgi:hypothetical protein
VLLAAGDGGAAGPVADVFAWKRLPPLVTKSPVATVMPPEYGRAVKTAAPPLPAGASCSR